MPRRYVQQGDAAIWGANAVNGVINVITKSAKETPGFFAEAGAGNQRDFASARLGGQSEDGDLVWRAYGKWFDRNEGFSPAGNARDDWRSTRFGFRTDWQMTCCDTVTVQGDYYQPVAGQYRVVPTATAPYMSISPDDEASVGGNALFRWTHEIDADSDWSLQCYYDRTERTLRSIDFREDRDTVDIDFQHRFPWGERHSTIWGGGHSIQAHSTVVSRRYNPTFGIVLFEVADHGGFLSTRLIPGVTKQGFPSTTAFRFGRLSSKRNGTVVRSRNSKYHWKFFAERYIVG